jgi:hypothetical protein
VVTRWDAGFARGTNALPYDQCAFAWRPDLQLGILAVGGGGGSAQVLGSGVLQPMVDHALAQAQLPAVLALPAVLDALHQQVARLAAQPEWKSTTAQAMVIQMDGQACWLAHVGLCRAYVIGTHRVKQLSVDHSLGAVMRQQGANPEGWHDRVVTRVLGMEPTAPHPVKRHVLLPQDRVMMCTEALHHLTRGHPSTEDLAAWPFLVADPGKAAANLLHQARGHLEPRLEDHFEREAAVVLLQPVTT